MTLRIMALLLCLFVTEAYARWKPQYADADPAIQTWFATQHNANGEWCCSDADGHKFYGEYKVNEDGSVTAYDGQSFKIEKYKVLNGPNPTGAAVWWYVDTSEGRNTYCFSLGTMG